MPIGDTNDPSNPKFWVNMAAEHIYNSPNRRTDSVTALKTLIVWAFTLFSVGGFALTLFGGLKDFEKKALFLFGIAFFLLTLAYYIASEAQFPKLKNFRIGQPDSFVEAFNNASKSQTRIFSAASATTGLAFFFLAAGILIQFWSVNPNPQKRSISTKELIIKTGVEKRETLTFIPATVLWEKNEPVLLTYTKLDNKKESILFSQIFYTDTLGNLFYSYPLSTKDSVQNLAFKATVMQKLKDTTFEKSTSLKLALTP